MAKRIPDAIYQDVDGPFTKIPHKVTDDTELTAAMLGVLVRLLSNKDGVWITYESHLLSQSKDGKYVIRGALKGLEEVGYLLRLRYVDKKTKRIMGSFWAYTSKKWHFNLDYSYELLEKEGFCLSSKDAEKIENGPYTIKTNKKIRKRKPKKNLTEKATVRFSRSGKPACNNNIYVNKTITPLKKGRVSTELNSGKGKNKPAPQRNEPAPPIRGTKSGCDPDEIAVSVLPEHITSSNSFLESWEEWKAHREEVGKPLHNLTARGLEKQLKLSLREIGDSVLAWKDSIDQSIARNWLGLFPLQTRNHNGGTYGNSNQNQKQPSNGAGTKYRDRNREIIRISDARQIS